MVIQLLKYALALRDIQTWLQWTNTMTWRKRSLNSFPLFEQIAMCRRIQIVFSPNNYVYILCRINLDTLMLVEGQHQPLLPHVLYVHILINYMELIPLSLINHVSTKQKHCWCPPVYIKDSGHPQQCDLTPLAICQPGCRWIHQHA
jgi:hypothetical protein